MSTSELAARIQSELEKTRNNVEVSVAVKEANSRRVRVVGSVRQPGDYAVRAGWRALNLVAAAGGPTTRAFLVTGNVIRGSQVLPVDLAAAVQNPDSAANPVLEMGDVLFLEEVDPSRNKIYVMGQVNRPGAYDMADEGTNLLSLLSMAGNPTETAALSRAYVMRENQEIPINLRSVWIDGQTDDTVRNLKLQPGDALFIPTIDRRIAVMGQVNSPGYFPMPETKTVTVMDALSLAGGQSPTGDLRRAGIVRLVGGEATVINLDIEAMLKSGGIGSNAVLQPEDVLYVPSRQEPRNFWRDVLNPISSLLMMGLRIF